MIPKLGFYKKVPGWRLGYLAVFLFTLVSFCFFPTIAWAEEATGEQIILTWSQDPGTSQTITWLSPDYYANKLQYIEEVGYEDGFPEANLIETAGSIFADSAHYRFSVVLTDLDPDTRYFYRIGSEENWSEVKSFKTASGAEDFSFLYLGDIQEGHDAWGNMIENIYNENPQIRFALLGGDLTNDDNDFTQWGEFLGAAKGVFSQIPVMPAKGNHDGELFFEFFALPDNGPPQGTYENFYSFDYGDAHFVVLDTSNVITTIVKHWIEQDLQNTDKKWKFAIFHHPPYQNFDDNKTIDDALREHWVPIFEQNHVDMVFVGHQHVYMRTHPIYEDEVTADSYGIVYVMGNSGSKFYSTGQGFPYIAKEESGSNYQVIQLEDDVLTLTSRKADGEIIETYMLNKGFFEEQDPHYQIINDKDNTDFTLGVTPEGIFTLTAESGISGFKDLRVAVASLAAHDGEETIIFAHFRKESQLQINSTRADFDQVTTAQAGFNVAAGDVIKIYVVDELTNADDHNPVILQH